MSEQRRPPELQQAAATGAADPGPGTHTGTGTGAGAGEQPGLAQRLEQATRAAQARRLVEADTLLGEILAEQPDQLRALDLLGFVRFFQQRYAEAEQACRRALVLKPDHAYARKGLGLCLARQGRLDEGIAELQRAIALKPGWFDPYWDLAVVLDEGDRPQEALRILAVGQVAVPARRRDFLGFAARLRAVLERRQGERGEQNS
ncbi:MAG: tetratricopeptide repeat protein [Deltaproteobacteria bacterium]|nr:tetratricopeptide repeat protein [Deltaproteobacteria bacterium]